MSCGGRGQRFAIHRFSSPCSLPSCLSISFIAGGGGEPIYKCISPDQSKNQHPEAQDTQKLARNQMDWVCKAQQLTGIRNLSLIPLI